MNCAVKKSDEYRDNSGDDFAFVKYFVGIIFFLMNLAVTCISNLISLPEPSKSRNINQIQLKSRMTCDPTRVK